jgi:ferric-dicitrate binding protein FerR (iron transport regulator)
MEVVDALKQGDLGGHAQRAIRAARETVNGLASSASSDRLRELADHANADRYLDQVKELERHYVKRAKKMERKFEQRVKQLPVDTPLDRRRRSRTRRRGAKGGGVLVAFAAVGGAIAYVVWRMRRQDAADPEYSDRFEPTAESMLAPPTANQGNGGAARQRTG